MSGLDSCLMSDLQVWITLAALCAAVLIFVPALGTPAWAERGSSPKLMILVLLLAAALGGFAWYATPATSGDAAASVAIAEGG